MFSLLVFQECVGDTVHILFEEFAFLVFCTAACTIRWCRGAARGNCGAQVTVCETPDLGSGDACVVEQVKRQSHDGLEPVVSDDPLADVALP